MVPGMFLWLREWWILSGYKIHNSLNVHQGVKKWQHCFQWEHCVFANRLFPSQPDTTGRYDKQYSCGSPLIFLSSKIFQMAQGICQTTGLWVPFRYLLWLLTHCRAKDWRTKYATQYNQYTQTHSYTLPTLYTVHMSILLTSVLMKHCRKIKTDINDIYPNIYRTLKFTPSSEIHMHTSTHTYTHTLLLILTHFSLLSG